MRILFCFTAYLLIHVKVLISLLNFACEMLQMPLLKAWN
jgi:hypothetical protein